MTLGKLIFFYYFLFFFFTKYNRKIKHLFFLKCLIDVNVKIIVWNDSDEKVETLLKINKICLITKKKIKKQIKYLI